MSGTPYPKEPLYRGKTHIPYTENELPDATHDVERRPAEHAHHDAHQKGDDDEFQRYPKRRIAKKSRDCGHGSPPMQM